MMGTQLRYGGVKPDEVPDQLINQKINCEIEQRVEEAQLPQELITEILLCSLVKSLLRFRCISKSFCTIINSKEFIYRHHKRSADNKKNRKLIVQGITMEGARKFSRLRAFDVDSGLEEKIKEPSEKILKPYGYCNGLILLLVDSLQLALWNPSTQQYRNLPICPIKVPEGGHCITTGMGLGYDPTRDDYKVVLIEDVMIDNINTHDLQVWVFRLRSNLWKKIHGNFPHRKDNFIYFGYFADGDLYWLCKPSAGEYAFVVFNVAEEAIVSSTLPHEWPLRAFHVLDGCLCMSYFCEKLEKFVFYICKKVGTKRNWIKLFSITREVPLLFDITRFKNVRVLGYSKDGDKIMLDLGFKFIVYFDLKARCFTTIGTKRLGNDDCYYPFLCHESLVSVDGRQPEWKRKRKRKLERSQSHDSLPN